MDKRIEKTKKILKSSLLELMNEKPFQKITVKELCDHASTSRITFYTYYEDKYELAEEIAQDIRKSTLDHYAALQQSNNPSDDIIQRHLNFVDALFHTEDKYFNESHRKHTIHVESPEMQFLYLQYIGRAVEELEIQSGKTNPRYPVRQFSMFLTAGIWAYIATAEKCGCTKQKTRKEIRELLTGILKSQLFIS